MSAIGDKLRELAALFDDFVGLQGPIGPQGPQGPQGPKGDPCECDPEPAEPEPPDDPPPPPPSGEFDLSPLSADPIQSVQKPVVGGSVIDPAYGVRITRATQGPRRHNYSRRQAFSHDGRFFIAMAQDGYWFLHDAVTCAEIRRLNGLAGDCEPIWHPSGKILHTGREGQGRTWRWLDVESNTGTDAFTIDSPFPSARSYWTKGEGTTSADGRYLALMCETYASGRVTFYGYIVVDTETGKTVSSLPSTRRPDHVSMSPTGEYVVTSSDGSDGLRAYSRDFGDYIQVHRKSEHSDIALNADGHDVVVLADYDSGSIRAHVLQTGEKYEIERLYPATGAGYACHISGQAFDCPGWVVVSTYADYADYGAQRPDPTLRPPYRKVWLAELKPDGRKLNLCHIRNTATGYFAEPQATGDRTLTRVMFASNMGDGQAESYVADVPRR